MANDNARAEADDPRASSGQYGKAINPEVWFPLESTGADRTAIYGPLQINVGIPAGPGTIRIDRKNEGIVTFPGARTEKVRVAPYESWVKNSLGLPGPMENYVRFREELMPNREISVRAFLDGFHPLGILTVRFVVKFRP